MLYIRCKHVRAGDGQCRQKSVQREMEFCRLRGCEGKGRLLDTTLAGPTTACGTPVTYMDR